MYYGVTDSGGLRFFGGLGALIENIQKERNK